MFGSPCIYRSIHYCCLLVNYTGENADTGQQAIPWCILLASIHIRSLYDCNNSHTMANTMAPPHVSIPLVTPWLQHRCPTETPPPLPMLQRLHSTEHYNSLWHQQPSAPQHQSIAWTIDSTAATTSHPYFKSFIYISVTFNSCYLLYRTHRTWWCTFYIFIFTPAETQFSVLCSFVNFWDTTLYKSAF